MASPLVQKFRNDTAPRLLAKFANGGTATVVEVLTPNVNPLLPPSVSRTDAAFNAYVKGVSASIITIDPNIQSTDLQVICAAIDFIPLVGSKVKINGVNKAIVRVDAIPAAGDPAIYRFYVR